MIAWMAAPAAPLVADTLWVIGSAVPLRGQVVAADRAGVTMSVMGNEVRVSWDRISATEGDALAERVGWTDWQPRGQQLNLIRRRIERGDFAGAERLLRALPRRDGVPMDASDLLVADAMLRCCLNRGALAQAVVPLLEVTRGLRAGLTTAWEPIVDVDTGWCAWLPPLLPDNLARLRLEHDLRRYQQEADASIAPLVADWLAIASGQVGQLEGSDLLTNVARALYGEQAVRQRARQSLEAMLSDAEPDQEGWIRFAIGTSLLCESGRGRQRSGVAELAWLPATHAEANPLLTGWALATLAAHLEQDDQANAAQVIRQRLAMQYPRHPALIDEGSWAPCLRGLRQEEEEASP